MGVLDRHLTWVYYRCMDELLKALQDAKADLAFALAQGDGYAEDAAAARIAELEAEIAKAQA